MGKTRNSANLVSDNNIFVDIANDRVGIGSTLPSFKLDVSGDINLSGTLNQNGSPFVASRWTSGSSNDIFRLNGNVGIGTTNPRFTLEVGAVGSSGTSLFVNGDARVTGILSIGTSSITLDPSDSSIKLSSDTVIRRDNSTGDVRFLDNSGDLKKIIVSEITVGTGITLNGTTGIISATSFYAGGSEITAGGGTTYADDLLLDFKSFNMQDESKYLTDMNLDAYMQPFRVRGLDTATEAFFGLNLATRQGSSTGYMSHTAVLFSVNQTTGAITKKGSASLYNTSITYDYSTFVGTSDEWSGRYTYSGNIPRSGSSGHQYGYNQGLVNWNGSSVTVTGTNVYDANYYPGGNNRETSSYVSPSERRYGGAATHILPMYNTSSRAIPIQHRYNYSTSSINAAVSQGTIISASTITSTNYTVRHFWQWDVTNEPYYDYFFSQPEGLFARTRSSGSWSLFQSGGLDQQSTVFHLSNGNIIVYYSGAAYMVTSGGTKTTLTASGTINAGAEVARYSSYGNCTAVMNIGEDEWLVAGIGGGWFWKFTINPTTGVVTESNKLQSLSVLFSVVGGYLSAYKTGWQSITGAGNYSSQMFTFGNENVSGYGYGRSKLIYIGGSDSTDLLYAASYDISGIVETLTYP